MRMAELSRTTGVPVATIKYYLREGLLPAGEPTAANQAEYGPSHEERLSLIRALREGGGLSIATIGRVLAAMDRYRVGEIPEHLTMAVRALSDPGDVPDEQEKAYREAAAELDRLLDELGWNVDPDSPGRQDAVRALVGIHRFLPGLVTSTRQLHPYADAVHRLAETEVPDEFDPGVDPAAVLRFSVLGTVLFEPLILGLRKLAHVDRIRSTPAATWGRPVESS